MNARHIFMCLALSLCGAGLQAQNDELPQVIPFKNSGEHR